MVAGWIWLVLLKAPLASSVSSFHLVLLGSVYKGEKKVLILFSLHVIWVGEAFTGNCEVVSTYAVCAAELCFGHARQLPAFSQGPSVSSSYPARDMLVRRRTGEEKRICLPQQGANLSSERQHCPPLRY